MYERIRNNLDDTLNNSSNILFGVKLLSYIGKSGLNRWKLSSPLDNLSKRLNDGVTKEWLICLNGSYTFPENILKQPCRNYATEGLTCSFGCSCKFEHKAYPRSFCWINQATICEWARKTSNVQFALFAAESNRNIKYSPFKPAVTQQLSVSIATSASIPKEGMNLPWLSSLQDVSTNVAPTGAK